MQLCNTNLLTIFLHFHQILIFYISFSSRFVLNSASIVFGIIVFRLYTFHIGLGRFRILGGPRFRILGGGAKGGPNSQQAHDVVMTSMRRNDVASTSFRRHVPNRFLTNQCQIITFLIFKYDIIENSRIELRGVVLPVQVDALLGGPKGMLPPPLSNYWGGLAPPLPTPMFHPAKQYTVLIQVLKTEARFHVTVRRIQINKFVFYFTVRHHVPNANPCTKFDVKSGLSLI